MALAHLISNCAARNPTKSEGASPLALPQGILEQKKHI
jgi:hypothetical protein